ncbi:MAG: AraC family transcriptional regulator [Longimicrobiales bacterium]
MELDITEMAPVRVACLHHTGPYGPPLTEFWNDIFWPWVHAKGLGGRACYGISHDNPNVTAPEQCRYDACIEVPDDFEPDGLASVTMLPGGRYAVSHFTGTAATIGDAWATLFRDAIPQSGLQPDERPVLEYYPPDANVDAVAGTFECKLCVPVGAGGPK